MSLMCIVMFASCSSDDEFVGEENGDSELGEEIIIGVKMPDDKSTRAVFDDTGLKLKWEAGDKLVVYACDEGGQLQKDWNDNYYKSEFTIIEGVGKNVAKFKGYLPKHNSLTTENKVRYQVYYKSNLKIAKDRYYEYVTMDYTGVEQNGFNSMAHFKNYLFMAASDLQQMGQDKEARYLPRYLKKEELKNGVSLKVLNSYLRIDVRALPENLSKANEVKWLVNNYDPSNGYSEPLDNWGLLRFKVNEIKDIRKDENAHQYLYMPVHILPGQFLCADYYSSLVFSDSYTNTRGVSAKGNGKKLFSGRRYNVNVSVDDGTTQEHTLSNWDGLEADEIPNVKPGTDWLEDNQVGVKLKLKDGEKPLDFLEADNEIFVLKKATFKGWYIYQTQSGNRIESIYGLLDPKYAGVILGLISPLHLRTIDDKVCQNFTNLKELYFSPYVQNIGASSFANCSALDKIEIPYCTRIIQKDAFKGFKGHEIIIRTPEKQLAICAAGAFGSKDKKDCTLRLHKSWKEHIESKTVSNGCVEWAGCSFRKSNIIYIDDNGNDIVE